MGLTAETLSNISVAALVTAMVADSNSKSGYVLVVGLGLTGMSVVRYMKSQGYDVVIVDSREEPPFMENARQEFPDIEIVTGQFDEALFMGATRIVVSPGVSLKEEAIKHATSQGVEVVGDIELFAQAVEMPVIAVTGSNGKSTVVKLLGEMARTAGINAIVSGNIGVPVLDVIDAEADMFILELSSFQLETLSSLKPVSAAVLNVSPDHMDRYDSYDEYVKSKQRIYQNCKVAVINCDDPEVLEMQRGHKFVRGFTLDEPGHGNFGLREFNGETWLCKGGQKLIAEKAIKLSGRHNTANALAALALGEAANLPMADMLITLTRFSGLPHRTQWVAEIEGVDWVNDSKGTNVGASIAAINGVQTRNSLILIAGGISKDQDFTPLLEAARGKVRAIVLIGKDAPVIEQAISGEIPSFYAKDMADAVKISADLAHPGDTVLLSPACASFDMFNGYEHRGEVFVSEVEAMV